MPLDIRGVQGHGNIHTHLELNTRHTLPTLTQALMYLSVLEVYGHVAEQASLLELFVGVFHLNELYKEYTNTLI